MATEINIPVKLQIQNLQSLVGDLEKRLSNLKVGSTGFKTIQSLINSIRGEIDKLQVQTSKPFMDAGQFTKAEHSVERLEDQIDKVSLSLSRIKFSDLELTSEQKADLKTFEDQINSIKEKLRVVKSTAKEEFLNSALGQEWLKIDETAFSKSLSSITNDIRREAQAQKDELDKLRGVAADYQKALSENQRIKDFTSAMVDDPKNGTDIFSKKWQELTKELSNGKVQFQTGGKNLMVSWLESQLKLDSGTLNALLSKSVSASNISQELKRILNEQLAKNEQIIQNNPNIEANVDTLKTKYDGLLNILRQVGASEEQVAAVEANLRRELGETADKTQEYQQKLVAAAQAEMQMDSTSNAMKSQLESLRSTLQQTNAQFIQMQRTQQSFNQMKMAIVNFMGFSQVLNLTKTAIRNAINHIKELDSVMNKISIVTDMSTGDLWNQVDAYSKMAQTFGVSIKGAYEVSQIYYQQGLQTNDVLTLTNETLKLAKISGLDYATTTDYMTTAIRGFKMEMSEASRVVDVYSNLASHTAVSQEELAVAMSKTASSMEAVGATFEEASAMIGTMVAVTRESATNIGSAMKSIASRYGELTKDPTKLVDEDGEAMAFNKVDAALQSVGISMKTVDGQFRNFTDVIIELGEKWNELDSTQQRYIATQFAGNRQQSRFLALVSNVDMLKSNLDVSMNSEDTGTLQALKALDSIEAKTEQVRVAYQQFYTTIGAESVWKGFLDGAKNVINTLNSFPKLFGKLPVGAIAAVSSIINVIKSLGVKLISSIAETFGPAFVNGLRAAEGGARTGADSIFTTIVNTIKGKLGIAEETGAQVGKAIIEGSQQSAAQQKNVLKPEELTGPKATKYAQLGNTINTLQGIKNSEFLEDEIINISSSLTSDQLSVIYSNQNGLSAGIGEVINKLIQERAELLNVGDAAGQSNGKLKTFANNHQGLAKGLQSFGSALQMASMMIDTSQPGMKTLSGTLMSISGAATLASVAMQALSAAANNTKFAVPWMAVISGLFALINGISTLIITPEEKLKELEENAEQLSNKAKELKADYRTLDNSIKKIDELKEKRYESAEAAEEYQTAVDELADKFPAMIAGFDAAGNIILDTTSAEQILADARKKTLEATYEAAKGELEASKEKRTQTYNKYRSTLSGLASQTEDIADRTVSSSEQRRYQYLYDLLNGSGQFSNINVGAFRSQQKTVSAGMELLLSTPEYFDVDAFKSLVQRNDLIGLLENEQKSFEQDSEEWQNIEDIISTLRAGEIKSDEEVTSNAEDLKEQLSEKLTALSDENLDINSKEAQNLITEINGLLIEAEAFREDGNFFDSTIETFNELKNEIGEFISEDTIYQGNKKLVISAWLQEAGSWSFLTESASGIALLTKQIADDVGDTEWSEVPTEQKESWKEQANDFQVFWKSLNEERKELFNRMIEDTSNYTYDDILEIFSSVPEELISTYYTDEAEEVSERLASSLASKLHMESTDLDAANLNNFYNDFYKISQKNLTTTEEQYLNTVLDQYSQLISGGYTNHADTFGDSALKLFNKINDQLPEIEKQLWQIIKDNGLTTLEGIENIKNNIKNNESLKDIGLEEYLDKIADNIVPNINLSIQTATFDLLETWEDTSKELNNAINGGLGLKDASSLIQKAKTLGIDLDLTDFQSQGDKLILVSESFGRYYDALTSVNTQASEKWQGYINQAQDILNLYLRDTLSENQRATIKALAPSFDFDLYLNEYGELNDDGIKALQEAISTNQKDLDNYNQAAQIAADQLLNSYNRNQGIYQLNVDGPILLMEELSQIAQGFNLEGKKLGKNDISQRAIKDSLNSTYDTLISDVLSKGFDNINLDDYEGLISHKDENGNIVRDTINLSGKYQDFVSQYASLTGGTVDEINDLILQAIEKDRETVSEDLLSDLTFIDSTKFYADKDALGTIANAFDKPIQELINSSAISFDNATQEYLVDIGRLKDYGVDLTAVDNFGITVQESIESLFSSLSSDIESALSGTLDAKGTESLKEVLSKLDIDTELEFTRTKDGYKLAVDNVEKLYEKLQDVDSLTAQIVLDSLNESIEESVTGVKLLNKEVASLRATTESDDFSFMDNDIPSGQNNPINYYQNWSDAFKAIREAGEATGTDKNKIDYTDFYNIITEMGNLADRSGDIKLSADTVLSNSQDASDLITQAAGCLSVATDGSIKVDLSQLGIDFSTGADSLKSDVADGIKSVAQSQIDMLDSMISLLEVIVAMENLEDIDVDSDLEIEIGEIFKLTDPNGFEYNLDQIAYYTDNFKELSEKILNLAGENEDLEKALTSVKVGQYTVKELFEDASDGLKDVEISAEAYTAIMNAFYKASISGDYNLDSIFESIKEVLASSGFEGEITIGDYKLTYHAGVMLTSDKEGNYIVNGKNFGKDQDKAAQAIKTSTIDALSGATKKVTDQDTTTTYTFQNGTSVKVECSVEGIYTATLNNGKVITASTEEGLQLGIAAELQLHDNEITSEEYGANNTVTYTIKDSVNANVETEVTYDRMTGKVTYKDITHGENGTVKEVEKSNSETTVKVQQAAQELGLSKNTTENTTIQQGSITVVPEQIYVDVTGITPQLATGTKVNDVPIDTLNAVVTLLTLIQGEDYTQESDTIKVEDLDDTTIKAGITALTLLKKYTDQTTGEVKVEDITDQDMSALITSLILVRNYSSQDDSQIKIDDLTNEEMQAFITVLNLRKQYQDQNADEITIQDLTDEQLNAIITVLRLQRGYSDQENGDVSPEDLTDQDIQAFISLLRLVRNYDEQEDAEVKPENLQNEQIQALITLLTLSKHYTQQDPGDVKVEDLPGQILKALINKVSLVWSEGANKKPDSSELGIDSDIESDNTITLHQRTNIQFELTDTQKDSVNIASMLGNGDFKQLMSDIGGYNTHTSTYRLTSLDYNEEAKTVDTYVNSLYDMVSQGKSLSEIDLSNLDKLSTIGNYFTTSDGTSLSTLISEIQALNSIIKENTSTDTYTSMLEAMSNISTTNIEVLATQLDTIYNTLLNLSTISWETLINNLNSLSLSFDSTIQSPEVTLESTSVTENTMTVDADTSMVQEKVDQANKDIEKQTPTETIDADNTEAISQGQDAKDQIDAMIAVITINADGNALGTVQSVLTTLQSMNGQTYSTTLNATVNTSAKGNVGAGNLNSVTNMLNATGNVGFANAQGTLMGELGPELVVSNGRYFVAGQSGPEFVDLAKDAIVFNHLQTASLLNHGMSSTRGRAVTNERVATAYATGNINGGPAMASASAALAALKQLRAQWESLLNMSSSDLSNLGGSGSGGGGGGDDSATARSSYLADVERWYNWLQKIAVLEEKINTEEAKRSKYQADMVARGAEYAKSNLQTLKDLQSEAVTYQALANTQQEFFNLRRSQLNNGAFSRFYTFDENGQLKYNDSDLGYKFLAELMARDDYGEAKYSAEQQYNMLVGAGMEAYMKYDSSGTEILMDEESEDQSSFYSSSVQAFWDLVDSQKEEMQSLHDSIVEYGDSVIEKQTAAYEIMKEIEDNQISVEDKVYNALVDLRQRAIDELQNQRDAIEKASNNLINGLTEQLNKEKDMYSQTESTNELYSLQRQLAVLQRSGGAASAIASLQKEIASKQQDMYYDAQQRQIDALQEASDNELEKLDEEISLMTETLEYEKEHGFLWQEIADIMRGSPEDIATYIFQNDSQFWGDSPTKQTQTYREALFEAQQFVEYRDSITDGIDGLAQQFSDYVISQKAQEEAANKSTSTGSSGSSGGGGSGGGSDDDSSGSGSSNANSSNNNSSPGNSNNNDAIKKAANVVSTIAKITGEAVAKGTEEYNKSKTQEAINIVKSTPYTAVQSAQRENIVASAAAASKAAKMVDQTVSSIASSKVVSTVASKVNSVTSNLVSSLKNFITGKKASGGYVGHGIYELGEQGTETVLTAQQTKILRDNILSNRPNSLLSLLKSYNESYDGITDSTKSITPIEDNSVTIEQAVVEMHVSKIANDYDAQRAGEQALEKMLTIARKTSAQNRIGR